MKKNELKQLKEMTLTELSGKSRELRQEMFTLNLHKVSGQLEKPTRLRVLRRDIARIETQISLLRNKKAA